MHKTGKRPVSYTHLDVYKRQIQDRLYQSDFDRLVATTEEKND